MARVIPRFAGRRAALRDFLRTEVGSAALLFGALIAAIVWATAAADSYTDLWYFKVGTGPFRLEVRDWIGEGLMALFFLVVGLEVRREASAPGGSERSSVGAASVAAIGGMVFPAALAAVVLIGSGHMRAWAIPIATDIALALGLLALLGHRITTRSRSFLLTLAIVDDIGAVVLIALVFPDNVQPVWLLGVAASVAALWLLTRSHLWPAFPLGIALWVCMHEAGVHASLAGFLVAVCVSGAHVEWLERLEHRLHPMVALGIVPLFAISHAGVPIDGDLLSQVFTSRVGLAILLGLVVGKPVGIVIAARFAKAPLRIRSLWTVGAAGGIGCTVALFVAELSLGDTAVGGVAKVAVIVGSIVSATVSFLLGLGIKPRTE